MLPRLLLISTKDAINVPIAREAHISVSTVIRWFDQVPLTFQPATLPEVLSIDEFRGNTWGQRYQVAINNPKTHEVLDIISKKDTTVLTQYFMKFSRKVRNKVRFVVMDLCPQFRKVVRDVFPNAQIIGDRFHILRLVIWAMERVRKEIQTELKKKRIPLKRNKHLLNKRGMKLTQEEALRLRDILKESSELQRAYGLKESFLKVLAMEEPESVREFLSKWLELVKDSGVKSFNSVVDTFTKWRSEIIAGLSSPYSNGFTEGMNNKIKVLKRVGFGFVNFKRFRKRILFLQFMRPKK